MQIHNILIIGSGGREHALAWKLKQSPKVEKIFIAPGNAGTSLVGENVFIPVTDIGGLVQFAIQHDIYLTIVGPDDPLALGVVDAFQSKGLKIWGPTKAAAQMEWSKAFAKEVMNKADIPTAKYKTFSDYNQALEYIQSLSGYAVAQKDDADEIIEAPQTPLPKPVVIKASGLALGKGVVICKTLEDAENNLRDFMINKIHGEAGSVVVIEEFLEGREFSAHALSDGKNFKLFPFSQDHKRVFDGDEGPNTGGMGTVAPLPWVTEEDTLEIKNHIVYRALSHLNETGTPFVGLLYPGLMAVPVTSFNGASKNDIKVIEFNSRFGDPECQSYMRLLKTDLFDILMACVDGRLGEINIEWAPGFACCIALASGGYPGKYEKGKEITGVDMASKLLDIEIFHAGTKMENEKLITNGGRVLGVTAIGHTLKSALDKAYSAIKLIHFEGMHYRKDIGQKSLPLPNTKETKYQNS